MHAAVAKRKFGSENVKKTDVLGALFEVRMSKKYTPLWRKAHLEVKMYKTPHGGSTFGSSDVEKLHAAVAKRTFGSENVQNASWVGALLEVLMRKNCTPLWRKCKKKCGVRNTFGSSDVEKLHTAVARSTFASENVQNTCVLAHFFELQMSKNQSVSKFVSQSISQVVN